MNRQPHASLPIVLLLAAFQAPALALGSPILSLDFGVSDDSELGFSDNRVQPQFSDFAISDHFSTAFPVGDMAAIYPPATITRSFSGITVTITGIVPGNGLFFVDRGTVFGAVGPLIEDYVGPSGLNLEIAIDGLAVGRYKMTSYHHRPDRDTGFLMPTITVTDALGNHIAAENVPISFGFAPTDVSSEDFEIVSDGISEILVSFDGDSFSTSVAVLNGFSIERVPEPAPLVLVVLAVACLYPRRIRSPSGRPRDSDGT